MRGVLVTYVSRMHRACVTYEKRGPDVGLCTRTSFLTRMVPSCSPSRRCERIESTSSMKMTDGCFARATAKRARTWGEEE